jgi:hypothetical protein
VIALAGFAEAILSRLAWEPAFTPRDEGETADPASVNAPILMVPRHALATPPSEPQPIAGAPAGRN